MAEDEDRVTKDAPRAGGGGMSEAEIDETLAETFPASDPPSWTLGTDHDEESARERSGAKDSAGEQPRR